MKPFVPQQPTMQSTTQALLMQIAYLHNLDILTQHRINAEIKRALSRDQDGDLFYLLLTETEWDGAQVGTIEDDYVEFIRQLRLHVDYINSK